MVSNTIIAISLIAAMIISVVGTYTIIENVDNARALNSDVDSNGGQMGVNVANLPSGQVGVNVANPGEESK